MDREPFIIIHRKWLLAGLVVVLFTNWAFATDLYIYFKEIGQNSRIALWLKPFIGEKAVHIAFVKGGAFAIAIIINTGISLVIIYIYFRGNRHIFKKGVAILIYFTLISIGCEVVAFIAEVDFLFRTTYYAITILPSPLIEALLIPILKLYASQKGFQSD